MDRWKYFDVVHQAHLFWNPLSEAKVAELIAMLPLPRGPRVLDIACGRAEFLFRVIERWEGAGIGVDRSPYCAAGARERAAARGLSGVVEIVEADGATFDAEPDSFDLVSCLGASWIWGGHRGTLAALARWTRSGGLVLAGEPFWRSGPSADHLEAAGHAREAFATHRENVSAGEDAGLRFLHSIGSNEDDWDRYEGLQCLSAELYARENPGDPDVREIIETSRRHYDLFLRWGRQELGWATYLFLKP
jgi:SAM-dependent methyltransferase